MSVTILFKHIWLCFISSVCFGKHNEAIACNENTHTCKWKWLEVFRAWTQHICLRSPRYHRRTFSLKSCRQVFDSRCECCSRRSIQTFAVLHKLQFRSVLCFPHFAQDSTIFTDLEASTWAWNTLNQNDLRSLPWNHHVAPIHRKVSTLASIFYKSPNNLAYMLLNCGEAGASRANGGRHTSQFDLNR